MPAPELYRVFRGKTMKQNLRDIVAKNNTGYDYPTLVAMVSNGNEDMLGAEELTEVDKTVNLLAHLFRAKINTLIPKRIDLKSKFEVDDEDIGICISIDEKNMKYTGDNLVMLSTYASDKGFNNCLAEINERAKKL